MQSFVDLFNPTFLMFLGILVLVVSFLVIHFENKIRDQNHKIASMLSLVSTLAEDMNGVKMGLNHLAIRGGGQPPVIDLRENLGNSQKTGLIEVSDDEEGDDDESSSEESLDEKSNEDSSETDSEETDYEESANDELSINDLESMDDIDNDRENSNDDIKIVKIQVSNEEISNDNNSYEETNNLEFDNIDEFEMANDYVEEVLSLKYDEQPTESEKTKEQNMLSSTDLKTISVDLKLEQNEEHIDYKKLQLAKLRSIVVEKGLTNVSDVNKLKKPELLKLLGVE